MQRILTTKFRIYKTCIFFWIYRLRDMKNKSPHILLKPQTTLHGCNSDGRHYQPSYQEGLKEAVVYHTWGGTLDPSNYCSASHLLSKVIERVVTEQLQSDGFCQATGQTRCWLSSQMNSAGNLVLPLDPTAAFNAAIYDLLLCQQRNLWGSLTVTHLILQRSGTEDTAGRERVRWVPLVCKESQGAILSSININIYLASLCPAGTEVWAGMSSISWWHPALLVNGQPAGHRPE